MFLSNDNLLTIKLINNGIGIIITLLFFLIFQSMFFKRVMFTGYDQVILNRLCRIIQLFFML